MCHTFRNGMWGQKCLAREPGKRCSFCAFLLGETMRNIFASGRASHCFLGCLFVLQRAGMHMASVYSVCPFATRFLIIQNITSARKFFLRTRLYFMFFFLILPGLFPSYHFSSVPVSSEVPPSITIYSMRMHASVGSGQN